MSYVRIDDRRRIVDENETGGSEEWINVIIDMEGWELFDEGVPKYKLSSDNWVQKRTDAEIKWDKKHPGEEFV